MNSKMNSENNIDDFIRYAFTTYGVYLDFDALKKAYEEFYDFSEKKSKNISDDRFRDITEHLLTAGKIQYSVPSDTEFKGLLYRRSTESMLIDFICNNSEKYLGKKLNLTDIKEITNNAGSTNVEKS